MLPYIAYMDPMGYRCGKSMKTNGFPRKLIYKMVGFSTSFSWFTSGSIKIGRRLCQSAKHALATSTQQRNVANSIDPEHG